MEIIFDNSAKRDILDYLDKAVDADGYIVEKSNPKQRVLNPEHEPIHIDEFGGVKKGSEVFFNNDVVSLMRLAKKNG